MADVDGTLIASGDTLSSDVYKAIRRLEEVGIMVGLVSGRTISGLESMARDLEISGPVIAENGGVAKLKADGEPVNLGYSRQSAMKALKKLKGLFPGAIKERDDNKDRYIDLVFRILGIDIEEVRNHLEGVQLLDSGYILHLMQEGISKGTTLLRLLADIGDGTLSKTEVIVFGDSLTDLSLFETFPYSVLVANPRLPSEHRGIIGNAARFASELPFGEGFAEVAFHIIDKRTN